MSFLPARMSRLLVGGHTQHLAGVIDALHAEGAVHIEDYRDPAGLTRIGTPLPAGERASDLLVKVRGQIKALGAEAVAPAGADEPGHLVAQAEQAATAVIDRATQGRAAWAALESEEAALRPYEALAIELSALGPLASVKAFVGQARADPAPALQALGVPLEVQAAPAGAGFAVAAVARAKDAAAVEKALGAHGFVSGALPAGRSGTPAARLAAIAAEKSRLQAALASSEADLARLRAEWGPRLVAAERRLASEVEKTQAPLRFGVTRTTFHVEGWVPRSAANRVKNALAAKFGDALYVDDLGDAPGHEPEGPQGSGHGGHGGHGSPGAAGGKRLAADTHGSLPGADGQKAVGMPVAHETDAGQRGSDDRGGHHATGPADEPPVHLENPKAARPYEFLLGLLGKPRYNELDPTKLMLFWFPLFFGLMVGDLVVGLIIAGIGLWMRSNHVFGIGGPAVGKVLVMGGVAAALVGLFVFGEALGIHFVTPEAEPGEEKAISWEDILGLQIPADGFFHKSGAEEVAADAFEGGGDGAAGSALAPQQEGQEAAEGEGGGLAALLAPHSKVHLKAGPIPLGIYSKIEDVQALLIWSVLFGVAHLNLGFFLGIRNVYKAHGAKLAVQEKLAWVTLELGAVAAIWGLMAGNDVAVAAGGGIAVASIALLWMGAAHVLGAGYVAVLEVFGLVGNLLSYTRLAAIGASKAGMVVAFSAIGFTTLGGGDIHSPVGWLVYLLGFGLIIPLSILAGGLQSLRLQFVEFFQKFYTGGGRPYVPFGRRAP